MMVTTTESHDKMLFAFDERILIRSSSTGALESSSATTTTTKTVRLESLAQWKNDAWIHPFSDIDLGLSSRSNHYKNLISRVDMSISSHGAQRFPTDSDGLDQIPVLPLWLHDGQRSKSKARESERYLSNPQGFFLSIRPANGLAPEEEARAVQAVFQELIRSRLLTTPVTGGEWDVVEDIGGGQNSSPRLYQIILPFDGATWSSDALAQSLRRTLPDVCGNESYIDGNNRFFGWSALEWSNFLVGYNGGGELGKGHKQVMQHFAYNKLMWWTWTSSSPLRESNSNGNQSLSFGIQYQTTIPSNTNDWLLEKFLDEGSKCHVGKRTAFEVTPNTADSYHLNPITGSNEEEKSGGKKTLLESNFSYSVGIEQVLRRHHTNLGRFESSIELNPLFDMNMNNSISCRMKYRQLFPKFLSIVWRSLRIVNDGNDDAGYDVFQASVEWNPESSILTVDAFSDQNDAGHTSLPSAYSISLEYETAFLTIDDFPGDPNRGRVLPPARVTVRCDHQIAPEGQSVNNIVYSNSLLLLPAVPDLSMPFNVISLTSSLYAYIIGAIITILVRKASEKVKYKMYPEKKPEPKLTKLKTMLRKKVGLIKAKLLNKSEANTNQKDVPR